jgi:hypothetical protein
MFRGFDLQAWASVAFGNLPLHAFHQQHEFFRLMISLSLLAHFLEVLRSVGDAICHGGYFLKNLNKREALAYLICPRLPTPRTP